MFSTEHQNLSRPLEKRLATPVGVAIPRLKTTALGDVELISCKSHFFFELLAIAWKHFTHIQYFA